MPKLNERLFESARAEGEIEELLEGTNVPFERLGWDSYDNSLELYDVPPEYRLSEAGRAVVTEAGFATLFMNHTDKWETHYALHGGPEKKDGWRVSYPHKRADGDPNIWVEDRIPATWPTDWNVTVWIGGSRV